MVRKLGFGSALFVSLLWAASALADPSAEDRATARSLAGEGYQALQTKDYSTAVDRFSRADALVHAPTLMIDWARSLVGLGKLVEAQERYEQIIREGVDAKAPRSWQHALTDATNEVAELKPRLAWVTITVNGSNDARVTIDGTAVPPAAIGVRRAVNPGQHVVRVGADGFLKQQKSIELGDGADGSVDFQLKLDPDAATKPEPKAVPAAPLENTKHNHDHTPSYVAFGVGGIGLVVGGVTGALALSKRATLIKACDPSHVCATNEQSTLNAYDSFGTVSAVGFGLGVVGIGAGLALWLLDSDPSPAPAASVVVRPYVGFASLGAMGVF
jgi:hypothetical protein